MIRFLLPKKEKLEMQLSLENFYKVNKKLNLYFSQNQPAKSID